MATSPLRADSAHANSLATITTMWSAAMTNIERYSAIVASRPNYQPKHEDEIALGRAACEWQCAKCYMTCAIAPDRVEWWQNELAKTCGSSAIGEA